LIAGIVGNLTSSVWNRFALRLKQKDVYGVLKDRPVSPPHPVSRRRAISAGQEKFQPYLESKLEPLALPSPSARNGENERTGEAAVEARMARATVREVLVTP